MLHFNPTLAAPLIAALVLDRTLGQWPNAVHPVVGIGKLIDWAKQCAPPAHRKSTSFVYGAVIALALPAGLALGVHALHDLLHSLPGPLGTLLATTFEIFVLSSAFALRMLGDAGLGLEQELRAGRLAGARARLSWLCSRDPSKLGPEELRAATIESLAENASDSVVAPLFWYAVAGLPGIVAYRAINTLDAMWGYRGAYEWLGKTAARLDDLVNLVPARLTAAALMAAAPRGRLVATIRTHARALISDLHATPSPNAGWPMACAAYLLELRLTKPGVYVLHAQGRACAAGDVERAWALVQRACWLAATAAILAMTLR